MTNPNDRINPIPDYKDIYKEGLTKREFFAAMAMQGYISCGKSSVITITTLAECSVQQADALIKALNETK